MDFDPTAPTLAEIRLQLVEAEMSAGRQGRGSIAWLVEGINIENAQ